MEEETEKTRGKVKKIRDEMGWTQAKMAEVFNVSLNTVKKWENGNHTYEPTAQRKKKINNLCKELGLI
jgi:DNA-binding transcriptional regulator YiaG